MANGRIPRKILLCAAYIDATDDYLQTVIVPTHGTRLGLSIQDVADWHTWRTGNDKLMVARGSKLTKTPDVNAKVKASKSGFIQFAQPRLGIIANSANATTTDANMFNVVLKRKSPTHLTQKMKATCNVISKNIGGGDIQFKARTITDAKRPSIFEDADSVQCAYVIGTIDTKAPDPDSGITMFASTKAAFVLSLGVKNSGKYLYIYFRWYNSAYPLFAGPWCVLQILLIP